MAAKKHAGGSGATQSPVTLVPQREHSPACPDQLCWGSSKRLPTGALVAAGASAGIACLPEGVIRPTQALAAEALVSGEAATT